MSWIKQGIAFATLSFITLVIFIVMTQPYDMILDTVQNESDQRFESEMVDDHITPVLTTLRTLFGILFVLSMVSLFVGIFLASHEEEYEEYPERYRRL